MLRVWFFAFMALAIACLHFCSQEAIGGGKEDRKGSPPGDFTMAPVRMESRYLPNSIQVHAEVICGGQPRGTEGFKELKSLGVKTVISVDGLKPDLITANQYGIRYVHLPHGYDGIPADRVKELAKTVRDLNGPFYIHCHHGKHRGPAAASVACIAAGLMPESLGKAVLELAGTSRGYRGLYQSVGEAKQLDAGLLDHLDFNFPETSQTPPLASAMVALANTYDRLQVMAESDWQSSSSRTRWDPAGEALLMREHFTELLRADDVRTKSEAFLDLLRSSQKAAFVLENALRPQDSISVEIADKQWNRITANCKACHQRFREVPLREQATVD